MNGFVSLGLPATGKSTYLAALWHVLESREVPEALHQRGLQADREYLNKIRDAWISFAPVPRTEMPVGTVEFDLADADGTVAGRVRFPDLPGESFRGQWTERFWTEEFDRLAREAQGFLLFTTPEIRAPLLIAEANQRVPTGTSGDAPRKEIPWSAALAPTQAQLVEILQFLVDAREPRGPTPLVVVVSAWDLVVRFAEYERKAVPSPDEWVRLRMPLLWQYLQANPELFRVRSYGISAQGGALDDAADRERVQDYAITAHRISVVEEGVSTHDPTRPLRWLLDQSRAGT